MQKELAELVRINAQQADQIQQLLTENRLLSQKIQLLLSRMFGRKSEQLSKFQLELLLGELSPRDPDDDPPPSTPRPRRGKRQHKPRLPEDLPTEDIVLNPEEVDRDPKGYKKIGEEVTEELDIIPARYIRRRYIRPKYKSREDRDRPPIIAPLPPRVVEGGYASPGLLSDIIVKKYVDHLPLYRQEQIMRSRYGIELSRRTMSDWVRVVADWLKPIYNHIRDDLRKGGYLQIDESPVRYCQAEGGGSGKGYLWLYHRPGAEVLYEWHTGRGAVCLDAMLEGFGGTVQCDGYKAYSSYANQRRDDIANGEKKEPIDLAACWAHARRKFHEALEECPSQAGWFLNQIGFLYHVESGLREQKAGAALRNALRSSQSAMILDRIEKALRLKLPVHLPQTQMGKAIGYALSLWPQLARYVNDGRLEIDNNLVENAVRPTAVGKKNYLFFGHPKAGDRSAIIYTLVENCKRQGINPQEYLRDVLGRLPSMTNQQTHLLTPTAWLAARSAAQAA